MRKAMVSDWISILLAVVAMVGACNLGAQEAAQPPQEKAETEKKEEIEGEEAKPEEIEEIRVVAPPLIEGNTVNRLGSQVTTVGKGQIHDLNALDLPSALRRTPGVTISRYNLVGGFGGADGGAIYIRGMGSGRPGAEIMTMVDGIPKFVGVWTHPLLDTLSVNIADTIDVYKGAQPVLFGPMAYGAVNIHSKRRTEPGFETRAESAGGSYKTWYEVVEHGGKVGPFDYYLVHNARGSSGHREKADGRVVEWFGRTGLDLGTYLDVAFTIQYSNAWANDPGRDDLPTPDREKFKVTDTTYMWELDNAFDMARGYLKFYYDDGHIDWEHHEFIQRPGHTPGTYYYDSQTEWDNWGIRFQETVEPWQGGEITLGIDYDVYGGRFEEDCEDAGVGGSLWTASRRYFYNTQPYFSISQSFGSKDSWYAIPSAGFRFNEHSEFQNRWTPQAGFVLGYKDTEGHFYYARDVNYPGVYTIFQYQLWELVRGRRGFDLSVDDLLPEVVDHYEFGISHEFTNWLKGDATAFWDRGRNAFSFVSVAPPFPPLNFYGSPQPWHSNGVELTATITPHPDLAMFAGATFLHARSLGEKMPNAPEVSFTSGLTWRFLERFQLNLDAEYIGKQVKGNPRYPAAPGEVETINGYFLMNGKLSCRVTPKDCAVQGNVFAYVENITDTNYELRDHYPAPPTSILVGGEIRF